MSDNAFHDHLDVCSQCSNNPLNLCEMGIILLKEVAAPDGSTLRVGDFIATRAMRSIVRTLKGKEPGVPIAIDDEWPDPKLPHYERQRRSFAYGNTKLSNPNITREMVDKAADANPVAKRGPWWREDFVLPDGTELDGELVARLHVACAAINAVCEKVSYSQHPVMCVAEGRLQSAQEILNLALNLLGIDQEESDDGSETSQSG